MEGSQTLEAKDLYKGEKNAEFGDEEEDSDGIMLNDDNSGDTNDYFTFCKSRKVKFINMM